MPHPAYKIPRAAWDVIRDRFEDGETAYALAREFPITRQAIEKRARREGWLRPSGRWDEAARATPTALRIADPRTPEDRMIAAHGRRTPEIAVAILNRVEAGASESLAARALGLDPATLRKWKSEDPEFELLLMSARHDCLAAKVRRIHAAGERDWRADAWALERAPETREEFGNSLPGAGGAVEVIINVGDARAVRAGERVVPREAEPIDVTPKVGGD